MMKICTALFFLVLATLGKSVRSIGEVVRYLHFLSDCLEQKDMHAQLEFM